MTRFPEITGERYGVAGAIGKGPVYPKLGSASLVVSYRPDEWGRGPGQASGSRGRPSYVRVRAPGCYAAQIDGTSFSRVIVFTAVAAG